MDIYSYAKSIDYLADYYDNNTGNIYKIREYGDAIKSGLPTNGIAVVTPEGELIGYAAKK